MVFELLPFEEFTILFLVASEKSFFKSKTVRKEEYFVKVELKVH